MSKSKFFMLFVIYIGPFRVFVLLHYTVYSILAY